MLSMVIASAISAAAFQNAAATNARSALMTCLRSAVADAEKGKMAVEALTPHLRQACAADAGKLKSALVAFDVKNGIGRKQAAEDADLQLDDYYATQEEHYRYDVEKRSPKAASAD